MKVLLVNGSPREKGCTYTALCEIAKQLETHGIESEIFHIGTEPLHGCTACGHCKKPGQGEHCVYDDGVVNPLIDRFRAADGVVVGSPVYYAGPNGILCAALDRVFRVASADFAGMPAAGIFSCRRGGLESSFDRINKYFTISQMPVVPSRYWNGVHGTTPEQVREDEEGMQVMRSLADNMAWMLRSFAGEKTARPENEPKISTGFLGRGSH